MSKNQEKDYTISMENAEASVCMEGYTVTPEMREQCERVLWGEATGTTWLVWHYAKMIKYGLFQDNKLYLSLSRNPAYASSISRVSCV